MSGEKKSFFRERTEAQIRDMLKEVVETPFGLVRKIAELDRNSESLCLKGFWLIPDEYLRPGENSNTASRRNLRDGYYINLSQPYSTYAALRTKQIPLEIREQDLTNFLCRRNETEIFCLGYSFKPIIGTNRTRIKIPFWSVAEGCRRDSYDMKVCKQLPPEFGNGSKVEAYEGRNGEAIVIVKIPSSTKGVAPYKMRWENVAVSDTPQKRVTGWGTRPSFEKAVPHDLYNFGFKTAADYAYPHWIHAHQAIVRHFWGEHNLIPLEMSQYAILSREGADFFFKLCNNVVVHDETVEKDSKLRHLHIDEASTLMARFIALRGPRNVIYWDAERDGRIRDYPWEL